MWVKLLAVILFGTMGLAFICDWVVLDYTYTSAGRGIEHAIDAGIIKSEIVLDAQNGTVQLQEAALQQAVKNEFVEYMDMDNSMENKIMKHSSFELHLRYDDNNVPWVEVAFNTHVSFAVRGVDYPVQVNRKIDFESVYK